MSQQLPSGASRHDRHVWNVMARGFTWLCPKNHLRNISLTRLDFQLPVNHLPAR
jgi:hypothetical protein